MSTPKSEIPLTAIVKLIEYLDPSEEREHFEDMQRDGQDTSNHVWLSIKAVTEWLDSQGIPYRDPTAELKQAVAGEFAKHGIKSEKMTDWPGLTEDECRELCRELVLSLPFREPQEQLSPDAYLKAHLDARDAWLDVRLRARGCPEDQLAMWRERIRHRSEK